MTFNINGYVTVKLTSDGAQVLEDYLCANYHNDMRPEVRYRKGSIFKEQLWKVMAIFGPETKMGGAAFFERNEMEMEVGTTMLVEP